VSRATRALGALLLLLGLLAGCSSGASDDAGPTPASSDLDQLATDLQACPRQPDVPAADSDLPATVFDCFGGGTLDLSRAPGVPTVVNLWASWCGPCREELPTMQQLAEAAGGKVRVVGVISKDGVPQAESFAEDAKVTFPSAFDGQGNLMTKLGLHGLPYTYFLDPDGGVTYTQVGSVGTVDQVEQLVAQHLGVRL
jgi:cytochrome c biogenesis protein CcmG/thiol:disulfide interchange protein DsbE